MKHPEAVSAGLTTQGPRISGTTRAARTAQAIGSLSLLLVVSLTVAGCNHHHRRNRFTPVFAEREPNDDELSANYFGVLRPGDRFFIDGFCSAFDLDGFAFTAGQPIHVDFRLFVTDPFPDLDVCLFDPQIGGDPIECFETPNNPEQGGVDVTAGGLDFHLIVLPFETAVGFYSMEITVSPLFVARETGADAPAIRAVAPSGEELGAPAQDAPVKATISTFGRYTSARASEPVETILSRSVDPETGAVVETVVQRALDERSE